MSSQRQDRVGGAARRPLPNHQEVVVVINHLNRVGKPCLQLRPAAPYPALHLRRELGDEPGQSESAVTDHTVSTRPRLGTATEASPSTRDNDPEPINVKAAQRQEFTPPQGSRHLTKPHSAVNKSCQTRRGEAAVRQLPRCPTQQVVGRPSTPVLAAALRRARCGRSETSEDDRSLECVLVGRCLTDVTSDGPRGTGWLNR